MPSAIIRVSRQLLENLLRLPPGVEISNVSSEMLFFENQYAFRVIHPDFPETPEGFILPHLLPIYREGDPPVFMGFQGMPGFAPAEEEARAGITNDQPR